MVGLIFVCMFVSVSATLLKDVIQEYDQQQQRLQDCESTLVRVAADPCDPLLAARDPQSYTLTVMRSGSALFSSPFPFMGPSQSLQQECTTYPCIFEMPMESNWTRTHLMQMVRIEGIQITVSERNRTVSVDSEIGFRGIMKMDVVYTLGMAHMEIYTCDPPCQRHGFFKD